VHGAALDELGRSLRRPVPDDELVPGVEEPSRNASAHCAEADDCNVRHAAQSSPTQQACRGQVLRRASKLGRGHGRPRASCYMTNVAL
jgi:hypothetical protein